MQSWGLKQEENGQNKNRWQVWDLKFTDQPFPQPFPHMLGFTVFVPGAEQLNHSEETHGTLSFSDLSYQARLKVKEPDTLPNWAS